MPRPGRAYVGEQPRGLDAGAPRPTGWTLGPGQFLVAVSEDELRVLHALRQTRGSGPVRVLGDPVPLQLAEVAEYSPT